MVDNGTTHRAAWWNAVPGLWTVTPADARVHIWKSAEGVKLQALMRDHRKLSTIQKAKDHAEARQILREWQDDPKAGLPASVPLGGPLPI